jgi:hypothetical protein
MHENQLRGVIKCNPLTTQVLKDTKSHTQQSVQSSQLALLENSRWHATTCTWSFPDCFWAWKGMQEPKPKGHVV